uniref:receptor protein-tyrosine kinase n=1 Tax=Macrostomum lignano TaxID=282301 RepID=A0A1I8H2G7_9PLAT
MRSDAVLVLLWLMAFRVPKPGHSAKVPEPKICRSLRITNSDYKQLKNVSYLHEILSRKVDGCQFVNGDLHVHFLGSHFTGVTIDRNIYEMNTSFLDSIREVSGRVVITGLGIKRLELRNLRAIRGFIYSQSPSHPLYALEIGYCNTPTQILMPKLVSIQGPGVMFSTSMDIHLYCQLTRKISWSEVFEHKEQHLLDAVTHLNNMTNSSLKPADQANICSHLPECPDDCPMSKEGHRLCWSSTECQMVSKCRKRSCHSCYTRPTGEEECCDNSCLGGCRSFQPSECRACRSVLLAGRCAHSCRNNSYDAAYSRINTAQDSLMQAGNVCVDQCPRDFYCIVECPDGQMPISGICTPCSVAGVRQGCHVCKDGFQRTLTEEFLGKFSNCSTLAPTELKFKKVLSIDGNQLRLGPLDADSGIWNLKSVRAILVEKFVIKNIPEHIGSLSFLKNLVQVSGHLFVDDCRITHFGFASLKYVSCFGLRNVRGLCARWFPFNFAAKLQDLKEHWPSETDKERSFDNTSEVCRNAVCDPQCRDECWGPGPDMCVACRNFEVDGRCYATCQEAGRYNLSGECQECHSECEGGCSSPSASECERCSNLEEDGKCVAACSSREMRADSKGRCYSVASARLLTVGIGVGLLILVLLVLLPVAYVHYRRRMRKYEIVDLDEYLTDPSNPNAMAKLLIVNDDDVMKQKEIGSGAFGTVYKGILRSSTNKGVRELPVAIKVLRGHSPKLGQELLNEASMLARVQHPCCIRLVALCLTQEPQLITALMPRGCLLEFLRAHRNQIGAERMLRWGLQVAEGMEYLESLGIVHRDLAARNVLLQTPDQVRITDFGLARLLDMSEGEFIQTAGLLPVKWLGVECFESGLFSHKSDVWSYGVLLWEICTFGESPYNPYGIRSVEDITGLLKKGIRLNQPDICSIDFYNILLSCWLPHPESRPSFRDMVGTMNDCLACPSKYIAAASRGIFSDKEVEMTTFGAAIPVDYARRRVNAYIANPVHPNLVISVRRPTNVAAYCRFLDQQRA